MPTKAQQFKAETQRAAHANHEKAPGRRNPRRGPTKPAVPNPGGHNLAPRAAKNATYELEVSATSSPSRKSTRKSPTHVKTDSALRTVAMNRVASPSARSGRTNGAARSSPRASSHLSGA